MPISFESFYCVARIIGDHPKEYSLLRKREVIGTGFIIKVESELYPGSSYSYLVTAAHVIEDQVNVEVEMAIPSESGGMYPALSVNDWKVPLPKVDLAVAPWRGSAAICGIGDKEVMPTEIQRDLYLGGEVFYVGVLTPLDRPMVRSGTVGAVDQVNLGLQTYDYPAHLIDCRSYGGFSGSPVFASIARPILEPTLELEGRTLGGMAYYLPLAGMFTEHLSDKASFAPSRYGVGVMVRSTEIMEALMADDLREERRQMDQEVGERDTDEPSFTKVRTSSNAEPSGFERFENLTKGLLDVSKDEADEVHRGHDQP